MEFKVKLYTPDPANREVAMMSSAPISKQGPILFPTARRNIVDSSGAACEQLEENFEDTRTGRRKATAEMSNLRQKEVEDSKRRCEPSFLSSCARSTACAWSEAETPSAGELLHSH